jgi:UDP-N-acetylmuramyl pentapeptide phosphotransferase/UDP-N-acetylglucosamine-1-phosphate transferase
LVAKERLFVQKAEVSLSGLGMAVTASFVLSVVACFVVKGIARRLRLVDVPNERSLHEVPVPRLGGVAILLSAGIVLAAANGVLPVLGQRDVEAWLIGASVIAALGFVDDVWRLPSLLRLLIQVAVVAGVLRAVLRPGSFEVASGLRVQVSPDVALAPSVIFVVATTNIFNFMDGMDGLAATQTLAAGIALAAGAALAGQSDLTLIALVIAAAAGGFFVHNAPRASLFLGDAGSTVLGFTFGTLAILASMRPSPVPFAVVPLALSPFLLDGTFTILRRLRHGERIWRAHRTHLYQRAVATGLTHRDVLKVYVLWSAVAAAGAVLAVGRGLPGTLVIGFAMALGLGMVWQWVVRRETGAARNLH